ncbi:PhzF family phenazine biosynthesis protein [Deinococcus sp. UYEF24]
MTDLPTFYRVLSPARAPGGKLVAVFPDASGDLQARAAAAGSPLSVFVQHANVSDVAMRVFTPEREKGESDSGALAALAYLGARGELLDVTDVQMGGESTPAQLCGGEWLLRQGDVTVQKAAADDVAERLGLSKVGALHTARIARPNLAAELSSLEELQAIEPDSEAVKALGEATGTTGLLLYVLGGVPELGNAAVSFRAFGPLRGFAEDAASSNMFACLVGVLGARGLLPEEAGLLRGLQLKPGQPARLTAQYVAQPGGASDLWVGGSAVLEHSAVSERSAALEQGQ